MVRAASPPPAHAKAGRKGGATPPAGQRDQTGRHETLFDLVDGSGLTLQQIGDAMAEADPQAARTHARVSQMLRSGTNSVRTLRALAGALGTSRARIYAANDATQGCPPEAAGGVAASPPAHLATVAGCVNCDLHNP